MFLFNAIVVIITQVRLIKPQSRSFKFKLGVSSISHMLLFKVYLT